jgi:uncharacterized protein (TIGR00106 family)
MKVIADLCIVPMGVEASVAKYVAKCQEILKGQGLEIVLHANGTNIEGELAEITRAVEECYQALYAMGVPRIYTTLNFSARNDREQAMGAKVESVKNLLT